MPGLRFRNIDVDVVGPPAPDLRDHFRKHAVLSRDEADGFSFEASEQQDDIDTCVADLVQMVHDLPSDLRAIWDSTEQRYFDAGFDLAAGTCSVVVELSGDSLSAMSGIGVRLRITLYPALRS